jgi:pimeloyl-ACP methyl ester carboxylesterase
MKLPQRPLAASEVIVRSWRKSHSPGLALLMGACLVAVTLLETGCVAPIGADRVATQEAYKQVQANALSSSKPSPMTLEIVHRYGLDETIDRNPDEAVRQLHGKALETGERSLVYALSELSFLAGDYYRRRADRDQPHDASDYYLGAAIYAWLYLFGEGKDPTPSAFDRRFRDACEFYNRGLGLALTGQKATNTLVTLANSHCRLPVGEIDVCLDTAKWGAQPRDFQRILLADQYRVRGLSVRNRAAGLGTPLICVKPLNPDFGIRPSAPATALLRGPKSITELGSSNAVCKLEVYSAFDEASVTIGGSEVPLETDLTTYRAYTLSQSRIWKIGRLGFLAPAERIRSQLIPSQPFEPNRFPVVLVHGTFSSPVTWAEMGNALIADPEIRERYQFWTFVYGSGNPLVQSVSALRSALTERIQQLDPEGTNKALRQMVVIGHSQGGLLTKGTAIESGDKLWRVFSTNRLENLLMSETRRAELREKLFLEPLPFIKRVVFIATPHRGSYLAGGFVRSLAYRLVSFPSAMLARGSDLVHFSTGSEADEFLGGRMPTSLDGMSPKNPGLRALAEIPVAPPITAHSIVAVKGKGDYHQGRDGLVAYTSAHQDYAASEFIVRNFHSCLDNPATIEEVRRILHEHLKQVGE